SAEAAQGHGITAGPDGNMWFADELGGKVGKVSPFGQVVEYTVPTQGRPSDITLGPDGNLWFTETNYAKIGKITTAGVITEYSLPGDEYFWHGLHDITV